MRREARRYAWSKIGSVFWGPLTRARSPRATPLDAGRANLVITGKELEMRNLLLDQERELGKENPDVLITRHGIARWQEETNPPSALLDYESVLQDRIRILGPDHPRTKLTKNRMDALQRRMSGAD